MEHSAYIQLLLKKLEQGACTPEEAGFLSDWLAGYDNQEALSMLLAERIAQPADALDPLYKVRLEAVRSDIIAGKQQVPVMPVHRVHFLRRKWWAAAAVFLGLISAVWLVYRQPAKEKKMAGIQYKSDAAPGREGALLTLANGATIVLDSIAVGKIANQQGADIIKTGSGRLSYRAGRQLVNGPVTYNKLATPKARKFSMLLPDGTQVWLNAQSSVTFPSAFTGQERKVEVTGEVYFEVAQDKGKPFIVKTATETIQVLGTSFNINTYQDEKAATTTLLEGSIRVTDGTQDKILKPGEQVADFRVTKANLQQTMAWKNGAFYFEETDLKTIMRQISRWYDVTIVFAPDAPAYDFNAKLPDNLPVSEVLKLLELTHLVHFEIEGNTITVKK